MAELTANLFREYFAGSWLAQVFRNSEYLRDIEFNWPQAFGSYSAIGSEEGSKVPSGGGFHDNSNKITVAGWRQDTKRWCISWYNEFGGYGEMQWASQEILDGVMILYGFGHECKQESDDLTHHIISCEIKDQENFKYTIRSFKKGLIEIKAKRMRTSEELKTMIKKNDKSIYPFQAS